jgi:heptosyltransferase II
VKILVRATNWVGDAILAIPALEAVRKHWKNAEIVVAARPWVAGLYRGQRFADRVVDLPSGGNGLKEREGEEATRKTLRAENFNCALLLPNSFASAWEVWRLGIHERIGYSRDARRLLLTRPIKVPRKGKIPVHEVYYYLELIRRIGWTDGLPEVKEIRLAISDAAQGAAEKRLTDAGARPGNLRIAISPGATFGVAKCWSADRFAALAERLQAEYGADVILFGSASEGGMTSRISAEMKRVPLDLAGKTSIEELPALLAACQFFVGNDSGAMHVAAAVGVPVVAIFGPTNPEATAPLTPRGTVVRRAVFCSPCYLRECPIDHRCMLQIDVETVFQAVKKQVANG